jgi:hypothetical protein
MVAVVAPKDMSNDAAAVAAYVKDPWNVIGMLRVRVAQCVAALCRHLSRCRRANLLWRADAPARFHLHVLRMR